MNKRDVGRALLFGLKDSRRDGQTSEAFTVKTEGPKRTAFFRDGSGARAHTLTFGDGCVTQYRHEDGRVVGIHIFSDGRDGGKFDIREGSQIPRHPHHRNEPLPKKGASDRGGNAAYEVAKAWDRALRWNGLR